MYFSQCNIVLYPDHANPSSLRLDVKRQGNCWHVQEKGYWRCDTNRKGEIFLRVILGTEARGLGHLL